jgi:hypothetical protein
LFKVGGADKSRRVVCLGNQNVITYDPNAAQPCPVLSEISTDCCDEVRRPTKGAHSKANVRCYTTAANLQVIDQE